MNIKKIGRRFFYLQTTGNDSLKVTAGLSSLQAFIILGVFAIIKKIFFPTLHISLLFLFSFFIIISLSINYFNYKIYKKHNKDFTSEWNSETRKNKIIYRFLNLAFVLFAFSTLIYILKFLDHQI
jgi:glucan phosphoethanolaminetransferase (alkaline phosphatase superfamily)